MTTENTVNKKPHNIILENRSKMSISGINDIDSFDETSVIMLCEMGELVIKGENLKVDKLNVESGEVLIQGLVTAMYYSDKNRVNKSSNKLMSKIFR